MSIDKRIAFEWLIVRKFVDDALATGYRLSVDDGGDELALRQSRDPEAVMDAATGVDEAWIYVVDPDASKRVGSVALVYGNSPWEVICDHSDNDTMTELLAGASALADE